MLKARLHEIADRWTDGPLATEMSAAEVKHMIRALFENNERRSATLAAIRWHCHCHSKHNRSTRQIVISINQSFKVHEHMPSALPATDQWPCRCRWRSAWTQSRHKLIAASDRRRLVWVTGECVPASNSRSYSRMGWVEVGRVGFYNDTFVVWTLNLKAKTFIFMSLHFNLSKQLV